MLAATIAVNILLKIEHFRQIFVMALFRKKNSSSLSQHCKLKMKYKITPA